MTTFTLQDLTLPATADQAVEQITKEEFMNYGMNNPISASAIEYATQPTCGQPVHTQTPDLATIINTICTQLQLLTTIISQHQPSTTPPEAGENSLQECLNTTLQQADWFKDMVKDEVESRVESDVESYFERRFDPTDHFDFGDAVCNEVSDQINDIVRDQLDDVVADKLEEVVAEKLKSIRVVFD